MKYITDLHIHSKYSRACSKDLDPEHIDLWCQVKGIDIVACADFTHPGWFMELQKKLEPLDNGLYKLKPKFKIKNHQFSGLKPKEVKFIIATEVSCIYSKGGQVRRLHICVLFPSLESAKKFNQKLDAMGAKLLSDGRPILGIDAKKIAQMALESDEKALIIPAHVWTPWFAVFGSKSGFDSLEECFEDLTPHIYAIETGLSSDPPMNWRLSVLDDVLLVSNSDAHSLPNLGREANVFDLPDASYEEIYQTIKNKDNKKFLYTIEFFPEEGKYHLDGHAKCGVSFHPQESKKKNLICPKCNRHLTIGVLHRIEDLADRPVNVKPKNYIPFKSLVPLQEVIAAALQKGKNTKAVQAEYNNLINQGLNEFEILLEAPLGNLAKSTNVPNLVEAIERMRVGQVEAIGGYDGVYGNIKLFPNDSKKQEQSKLF